MHRPPSRPFHGSATRVRFPAAWERWVTFCLALLAVSPAFSEPPQLTWSSEGCWVLSRLPALLDMDEVEQQLQTGLTTHIVLTVESRGKVEPSHATVQIRYELWDEHYQMTTLREEGETETRTLLDQGELRSWWAGLEVSLCSARPPPNPHRPVRVTLQVIPFSASEQLDTQKWFADSVRRANRARESAPTHTGDRREGSLDRVFDGLLATSIRSRPMVRLEWTLDIEPEPRP